MKYRLKQVTILHGSGIPSIAVCYYYLLHSIRNYYQLWLLIYIMTEYQSLENFMYKDPLRLLGSYIHEYKQKPLYSSISKILEYNKSVESILLFFEF
jgi:hypothetical protein